MAEGVDPQQDVTYRAPVGPVDLKAFDDDGNSYEIRACHDCLPWHAEVVLSAGYLRDPIGLEHERLHDHAP